MKNPIASIVRRLKKRRWTRMASRFYETATRYIPIIQERFAASWLEIDTTNVGSGSAAYAILKSHLGQRPIVYSCGVGDEISFDLAMITEFDASVHAFDPTKESTRFVASAPRPKQFYYRQVGIAGSDGNMEIQTITGGSQFYRPATLLNIGKARRARTVVPVRSLSSLMNELAHEEIAVLKIDIEGSEYGLFESWPANWAPA